MITEHRTCQEAPTGQIEIELIVTINRDEARAIKWYAGVPVEFAVQLMVRDRIRRAVDAYERAGPGQGGQMGTH